MTDLTREHIGYWDQWPETPERSARIVQAVKDAVGDREWSELAGSQMDSEEWNAALEAAEEALSGEPIFTTFRHPQSGDMFAVEVQDDVIVRAAGPGAKGEFQTEDEIRGWLDNDADAQETGVWLEAAREQ